MAALAGPTATLTVQADKPGAKISPTMLGAFLEDVNFAADGGLYAELVKNRSFEFPDPMMGWNRISTGHTAGGVEIREDDPFNEANPHYLRIKTDGAAEGFGVSNEGFRGMGVRGGEGYAFSAQLRAVEGQPGLRIALVAPNGRKLAETRLTGFDKRWKKYSATLRATDTEPKARLEVCVEAAGALDLDMVSLFPEKTWKNRPNGLRADLVQMLADLKPGFIKFPGGFLTEGRRLDTRYQWKRTIGDLAERKLLINAFNQFATRSALDYYQSYGLGFFECFQLCEDIGAEPQPVLNCGMAAGFSGEMAPLDQLGPYIQDALDLIEFANGPVTSLWGKKRLEMGHPQPFHLKMIRLGNEQEGPPYLERYQRMAEALKARYPEIKLIAGTGPQPAGDNFKLAWDKLGKLQADVLDEHSHNQPVWFFSSADRFDDYDRNGSRVMVGEYCAHSRPGLVDPGNRNNLETALSEAAFLTGLERNADLVVMSSACALFAHVDAWQWKPDLIWFDNLRVYGTPNYYVQQLFSRNRGDVVLPVELQVRDASPSPKGGAIGVGTWATQAEFKDLKVVCDGQTLFSCDFAQGTNGWELPGEGDWKTEEGVLRQNSAAGLARAFVAGKFWTDCTYSLKARKLGGAEGFLIPFNVRDENAKSWWNLGGWGNTRHTIEMNGVVTQVPGSIETGRWHDIRIELQGTQVNCYLDGRLVQSAQLPVPHVQPLYASATRDNSTGEIILKVVNTLPEALTTEVRLGGVARVTDQATAMVLTSGKGEDENSLDDPKKVLPREATLRVSGPKFEHTFPAKSFTVLKVGAP
jgi:alpha-L-arabinofuranosidase